MKSLLFPTLLLIFSFCTLAQDQSPCYSVNDYQALIQESNPPISYQLVAGWNMVGYTGTADNNGIVTQLNQSLTNNATAANTFQIIKNVTGQFWYSDFAQLSNFTPGEGYMMYVVSETAPVLSFNRPITLPLIVGCTDCTAENFNPWASQGDGWCTVAQDQSPCYSVNDYQALIEESNPPISYQLVAGWNIVGYTGTADNNGIVTQLNQSLTNNATAANTFQIIKNVTGQFWSPSFAQLSNFTPGEGYKMYVVSETAPVLSFNRPVTLPLIVGCTDCTAVNFNPWASQDVGSCIILGCLDATAFNYDVTANTDDSSCIAVALGCTDATAFNYDVTANTDDGSCIILGCIDETATNYNALANTDDGSCTYPLAIGDFVEGGIVFYIDETGEHGLVAALEDLTEGSNMGQTGTAEGFEWGCPNLNISGADGYAIGTGYQNTLDISSSNCQTTNGGITAAQATLNYETEGYTDWFLPSREELEEMYNTIGNGGLEGNIGGFETSDWYQYWSSTESNISSAWLIVFNNGGPGGGNRSLSFRVRAVRDF